MGAGGSTVEVAALGEAGTGREGRHVAREEASVCLPALEVFPCLLSALGGLWCPCKLVKQCTCGGFVDKPRK